MNIKGQLGIGQQDEREMRALNKIVRVSEEGLAYEPDPRHVELLCRDLGFDLKEGKSQATPGRQIPYKEDKHAPTDPIEDLISAIRVAKKTSLKIRFNDDIEYHDAADQSLKIPWDHLL